MKLQDKNEELSQELETIKKQVRYTKFKELEIELKTQ